MKAKDIVNQSCLLILSFVNQSIHVIALREGKGRPNSGGSPSVPSPTSAQMSPQVFVLVTLANEGTKRPRKTSNTECQCGLCFLFHVALEQGDY